MSKEIDSDNLDIAKQDRKKKFLNGWTREQEELMSQWADIAMCYRWLHGQSEKYYKNLNYTITIPVIILSTLTGTASVGLSSIVGDDQSAQKYAQLGIGGVSIITGILSTLGNYLRFAQLQEGNRVASQAWGKFYRMISAELALHPDRRSDCSEFLKFCRLELDRLIEASPELHSTAVHEFNNKFGKINTIKMPDEADRLTHTEVFEDNNLRLKQLALDAALVIRSKKELLKDMDFSDKEINMFDKIEYRLKKKHESEFDDYVVDSDSVTKDFNNKSFVKISKVNGQQSSETSGFTSPIEQSVYEIVPNINDKDLVVQNISKPVPKPILRPTQMSEPEKSVNVIVVPDEEHNRVYDKI